MARSGSHGARPSAPPRPTTSGRAGLRVSAAGWAWLAAAAVVAVYVVSVTRAGPWDPWETHYGEVARQILVRQDPLDLWWKPGNGGPQGNAENTFWSKPPLMFWCVAVSMALFRVGTGAAPAELVTSPWTEVALRAPGIVFGLGAALMLGVVVARIASKRAGVLAGLTLATLPQWALVTRQALTDVYFAAPMVLAVGAWILAWGSPARTMGRCGRRLGGVPWDRAYGGYVVALVLLAVVPLLALHLYSVSPYTAARVARFSRRSGVPSLATLQMIAWHLWIYWALLVGLAVRSLRWTTTRQVWLGIMYLAAGASCMAKGLIGPGLIGAVVLADLVVHGGWGRLRRAGLVAGAVAFVLVVFPWHHAMWLYRGERWVNEWIVVNNLARFASGEQKQAVGSFVFYVQVMGAAAMPWVALFPAALGWGLRAFGGGEAGERGARRLRRIGVLWLAVSLWAITFSVTKYDHYLVPVLPPLALLLALLVDDVWAGRGPGARARWVGGLVGGVLLAAAVRDVVAEPAIFAHLTTYLYTGMWRKGAPATTRVLWAALPFALGLALWIARRGRAAALAWVMSALLTTAYVIDDYVPAASESWSQRSAFRLYFEQRGPHDRAVSWWFYYRGETFFTKGDIWVMKEPDRAKLAEYIDTLAAEHPDARLWFATTVGHAGRLASNLPAPLRRHVETVYENFHYKLLRVPVSPPAAAR